MRLPVTPIESLADLSDQCDWADKIITKGGNPKEIRDARFTLQLLKTLAEAALDMVSPTDDLTVKEAAIAATLKTVGKKVAERIGFKTTRNR